MRRLVLIFLLSAGMSCGLARTAEPPASDAQRVRAVIQAQLDAFAADDAERAFSYAAPPLQRTFGTPASFMRMVRDSYPVVYRHVTVAFLEPELARDTASQAVHFTDADGGLWLARYRLERQGDRSWRISACRLVRIEGRAA
jgi:hypothetical protein